MSDIEDKYYFSKKDSVTGKKVTIKLDQTNPFWIDGIEPMIVLNRESSSKYITYHENDFRRRVVMTKEGIVDIGFHMDEDEFHIIPENKDIDYRYIIVLFKNLSTSNRKFKININEASCIMVKLNVSGSDQYTIEYNEGCLFLSPKLNKSYIPTPFLHNAFIKDINNDAE